MERKVATCGRLVDVSARRRLGNAVERVEAILFNGFYEFAIVFPVREFIVRRSGSLQPLVLVLNIVIQRFHDESHGLR